MINILFNYQLRYKLSQPEKEPSILYIYYVLIGFYGYTLWRKGSRDKPELKVNKISARVNFLIVGFGALSAFGVGHMFANYTGANNPYLDAFTTVFSFVASFLEAKKIISSWVYWIFINAATIILYIQQELFIYLALTIVYLVFSVIGFKTWKKTLQLYAKNNA